MRLAFLLLVVVSISWSALGDKLPADRRVYPTPRKVLLTGGTVEFRTEDVKCVRTGGYGQEGYRIQIRTPGLFTDVCRIEASSSAGEFYALKTLEQLRALPGPVPCCIIEDSPDLPMRGVVEGFYGRPWGWLGRERLMDFLGRYKMNTFIYGPKDDLFHREKWREPYPAAQVSAFKSLLGTARRNYVQVYWAIHLGGCFSTNRTPAEIESDYRCLFDKFERMYEIGFRRFAVFLDDFGEAEEEMHVLLCNRVRREFVERKGDCGRLLVCPTYYSGDASDEYSRCLGKKLLPGIEIIWTGMGTCGDVPERYSRSAAVNYRRAPFVWWNWPVNDFCRSKLLMGRTYGIDPFPFSGFVSNPMENLEASKIALFGIADFTWNMGAFDSRRNWDDAFVCQYPFCAMEYRKFCEHNSDPQSVGSAGAGWFPSGWSREESVDLEGGNFLKEFESIKYAARRLTEVLPKNDPSLWREIRHWVEYFGVQGEEGLAAAMGDKVAYETAVRRRHDVGERHKRYFAGLAPEWDRENCRPCVSGTCRLQRMIDCVARDSGLLWTGESDCRKGGEQAVKECDEEEAHR